MPAATRHTIRCDEDDHKVDRNRSGDSSVFVGRAERRRAGPFDEGFDQAWRDERNGGERGCRYRDDRSRCRGPGGCSLAFAFHHGSRLNAIQQKVRRGSAGRTITFPIDFWIDVKLDGERETIEHLAADGERDADRVPVSRQASEGLF